MKRPNILLITSDQQHWQALGINNPQVRTPSLDLLASRGVVFTRAYCTNPTCTPARASVITGKMPSRHGAYSLGTKLFETEPVVGDMLQKAGYRTALVGKAHFQQLLDTPEYRSLEGEPILHDFDFWRKFHGPFYGFERVELARNHADENHVGQHYALWMEGKGFSSWRDCFEKPTGNRGPQTHKWNLPEKYHQDPWIAEKSLELLKGFRARGEPFFLWSSFFDPHPPYLVPEPWDTAYDPGSIAVPKMTPGEHDHNPPHFKMTQQCNPDVSVYEEKGGNWLHGVHSHLDLLPTLPKDTAVYYGMVSLMDKYIGKILAGLEDLGLAENTIVVFTTDHGHFLGQHGLAAKGPFHYEDMVKIPFIVRWPGRVPAGRTSSAFQSLVDLAPTFLRLASAGPAGGMDGVDQSETWTGGRASARDHAVVENRHNPTTMCLNTCVDARWKITAYLGRPYGELFDLVNDPGEVHNLWDDSAASGEKERLLRLPVFTEMGKEPLRMPRICGA